MAQKLDERPGSIYGPEDEQKPVQHDDDLEDSWNADNSDYDSDNPESKAEPSVAEQEANADVSDGNDSATNEDESNNFSNGADKVSAQKKSSKGKKIGAGLAVGSLLTLGGLAMFLPRIMSDIIVDRLTNTFMGRAQHALEERANKYVGTYVTKVIGGELRGTCGTAVNRQCVVANSLMGRLTEQWKTNRLEDKLLRKHGLEFELDRTDRNKINVIKNGVNIGEFGERSVAKNVIKTIQTETKFQGMVDRRHIRSVLARKYGANKFCIIACSKRDDIEVRRLNALKRLKLKILSKVSDVGATRTTAYLLCLSVNCSDTDLKNSEKEALDKVANRLGSEYVKELAEDVEELGGSRSLSELIVKRMVESLLTKVVGETTAKAAASSVPLIGQIYLAATAIELYTNIDQKIENREISKYLRNVNAQEAALYATQIINIADDNKSGQASFQDSWATFQLLNGAGESRLWQEMNGTSQKSTIECEDDVVLNQDDQELVCPETKIQPTLMLEEIRNDPTVDFIMNLANSYNYCLAEIPGTDTCTHPRVRTVVKPVLDVINKTLGFAGDALFGIAGFIVPGFDSFKNAIENFVAKYASQFFGWASKKLLPRMINPEAEDRLAFEQAAVGYDVLGNQFIKGDPEIEDASSIEGAVLSAEEQGSLDRAIALKKKEELRESSVFARYFDVKTPNSLANTTAIAAITGTSGENGIKSLPEFNVAGLFSTIFQVVGLQQKSLASLEDQDRADIFGVTQYGYSVGALESMEDPELLTPERCSELETARLNSGEINDETGEIDYTLSNPCALDEVIIDSFTKIDDLDAEGAASGGSVQPVGEVDCSGFTHITALNVTTDVAYAGDVAAQCQKLVQECGSVASNNTKRIVCEALNFDGVYYGNGYGRYSGAAANEIYGFTASSGNYGISAEAWLSSRSTGLSPNNLLECSGLTSVALYQAFGFDGKNIGCSGNWTQNRNPTLFRQITAPEIQPGDFLTKSFQCNSGGVGHIAIAASEVDSAGNLIVYETDSWGRPARFTKRNLTRDFQGGWSRYIGPGT